MVELAGAAAAMDECLERVNELLRDTPTWQGIGHFTRAALVGLIVGTWEEINQRPGLDAIVAAAQHAPAPCTHRFVKETGSGRRICLDCGAEPRG